MSDDDDTAPTEPAAPPGPKQPQPKIVLGLLAVNLALSAFILVKVLGATAAHAAPAVHAEPATVSRELTGPLVGLEPFVVNLNEPGSPRYLKVQVQAEVRDAAAAKAFEKNKTLIHDDVMGFLSNLRVDETLGDENKGRIRTELSKRMGAVIGEDRVRRVVFAEFVVQ